MAPIDFCQLILAGVNIFLVGVSVAHGLLKGKAVWKSEREREAADEDVGNDNDLPPEPVGFMNTQFEPFTKTKEYYCMRVKTVVALTGISIYAIILSATSNSIKESATVTTGTTVNIEGTALAKVYHGSTDEWKVWDPTDIADPAVESTKFFIATRRVLTKGQTLREDCVQSDVSCRSDSDCFSWFGKAFREKGIYTGTCSNGACTVRAWCPQAYNANDTNAYVEVLNGSLNFAVLIQSHMYLQFVNGKNFQYDSIDLYTGNNSADCAYDKVNDRYCPRFNLSLIIREVTGNDAATYDNLVKHGGVVSIRLDWTCVRSSCELTYHFTLLHRWDTSALYKGYRSTDSKYDYNTDTRTFIRSAGILFLIQVEGSGYRLSSAALVVVTASIVIMMRSTDLLLELYLILSLKRSKLCALFILIGASVLISFVFAMGGGLYA